MAECWVISVIGADGRLRFLSQIDRENRIAWKTEDLGDAKRYDAVFRAETDILRARLMHRRDIRPAIRLITYDSAVALVMAREIRRG